MKKDVLFSTLLILLTFIVYGCDKQSRYGLIATLFTGVPSYEEMYPEKDTKPEITAIAAENKLVYSHPIWKAGQCEACHEKNIPSSLLPDKNKMKDREAKLPDIQAAKLLLPAEKLCIKCHIDKTSRMAIRERMWLHNPVARGDCLACHALHESPNQALLQLPTTEICTSCHDPQSGDLPEVCIKNPSKNNKEIQTCLSCHNSHMGKDRFLLTRDFREIKKPAGVVTIQTM